MEEKRPSNDEEKFRQGGLLANVSLLTTGGSSLQQLTNNDLPGTSKQVSLRDSESASTSVMSKAKKSKEKVNTSTPARAFGGDKIIYGFDLSPVHSHEMPGATLSGRSLHGSRSADDVSRLSLQKQFEERLFTDSKAAPNFMQAPSVSSSHQSRLSLRKSDDTETMMSQVYSQPSPVKKSKSRLATSKKLVKSSKSPKTPGRVSPRKSSKSYSHVQGSGYGITTPWKSLAKKKSDEKQQTVSSPKKKTKSKQGSSEFLTDSALKLLAHVKEDRNYLYSQFQHNRNFEKAAGGTFKISPKIAVETQATEAPVEQRQSSRIDVQHGIEFESLQKRCDALEEECQKLKEGNDEINKENFLLTAKLNKLKTLNESVDPAIKDSLNDDPKDLEIAKLKKEIFDQERLMNGYQQENEKLYREVSKLKTLQRENENAMFNENLKLKNKIASLNEELDAKEAVIKDKNQILLEVENDRRPSVHTYVQTSHEYPRTPTPRIVDKDKEEIINDLKEKLSFFTKNSSKSEETNDRLLKANEEMLLLKEQVNHLRKELAKANVNSNFKESKQVEELRRQVKELETSLIKSQRGDHVKSVVFGDKEKLLLEERCQQLESRLKDQEDEFSNNMKSLHKLYKNMSKDYQERVEDLSDQLQEIKKQKRKSLSPKKERAPSPVKETCTIEQHRHFYGENAHLKLQVENLEKELREERKIKINRTPSNKAKKKTKQDNESTYHPDYFVERIAVKPVIDKEPSTDQISNQFKELMTEKESLLKEVVQWKSMYDDVKTMYEKLKESQETKIENIEMEKKKVINDLESSITLLKEELTALRSDLSKARVDLSSGSAREQALHMQIRSLLDELQETRRCSPNAALRQLQSIHSQIRLLDFRQKSREDKLDKVVAASADEYLKAEITSLHKTIADKNFLISKFQCELDTILRVLESLQKSKNV